MNNPFRIPGEVPVYPKEETPEEKKLRLRKQTKHENMFGALFVTFFPSSCLLALGFLWDKMTTAEASTSLTAVGITSFGVIIATGIVLDWFDDGKH